MPQFDFLDHPTPSQNIATAIVFGFSYGGGIAAMIGGPLVPIPALFYGGAIGGAIGCAIGWRFRHVGSKPKTDEPSSNPEHDPEGSGSRP